MEIVKLKVNKFKERGQLYFRIRKTTKIRIYLSNLAKEGRIL